MGSSRKELDGSVVICISKCLRSSANASCSPGDLSQPLASSLQRRRSIHSAVPDLLQDATRATLTTGFCQSGHRPDVQASKDASFHFTGSIETSSLTTALLGPIPVSTWMVSPSRN
ncbi:hypothetical protein RO3G_15501 [Rhizopus delemar RA 99-880]|uniref:Uncharacterized protein n=1 Tax=Rhizopus delemar (strain RA 99-880 / ATCC MYA-4621 / FGSC 9543 / NRRL 43880) TaxID=246409 RepID=I1CQR0_RHIO9|nr:hypothetical protein RO3G_15501 [Rhizopus delemar RA 99-880]|eukprot:EIE90790.1 hypothetical protein RO3G_15501 [Rhizopus delemar RA 99-880]